MSVMSTSPRQSGGLSDMCALLGIYRTFPTSSMPMRSPASGRAGAGRRRSRTRSNLQERKAERPTRTHWDMLLERRSIADLEELLEERLALLDQSHEELPKSA